MVAITRKPVLNGMKRYTIEIRIEELVVYVYVSAKLVLKTAHDQVVADGVTIELPGEIVKISE